MQGISGSRDWTGGAVRSAQMRDAEFIHGLVVGCAGKNQGDSQVPYLSNWLPFLEVEKLQDEAV